jgi:hypothetical protein
VRRKHRSVVGGVGVDFGSGGGVFPKKRPRRLFGVASSSTTTPSFDTDDARETSPRSPRSCFSLLSRSCRRCRRASKKTRRTACFRYSRIFCVDSKIFFYYKSQRLRLLLKYPPPRPPRPPARPLPRPAPLLLLCFLAYLRLFGCFRGFELSSMSVSSDVVG